MPPKKRSWGDLPDANHVKDKDPNGRWIHYKICDIRFRVRSQFSFTEWQIHTSGVKHLELTNSEILKNVPQITNFFKRAIEENCSPIKTVSPLKKNCNLSRVSLWK